MLVDISPQISVQQVVHNLKQISTYRIYQIHRRYLKQYYWKENTLFSDGYFACSSGDAYIPYYKEVGVLRIRPISTAQFTFMYTFVYINDQFIFSYVVYLIR